jgi:hypothetical protein
MSTMVRSGGALYLCATVDVEERAEKGLSNPSLASIV